MPFAETKTGRLHYHVCDIVPPWVSSPQTIVFNHGIAAEIGLWAGWLPTLALRYRLVRFDMRGFGKSSAAATGAKWSFDLLCDDLLAVADAAGAERFHLVGESIGGTIALAAALRYRERIQSLVLSNAAARGGVVSNVTGWRDLIERDGQSGWARELMRGRFHPGALPGEIETWFRRVHETCSMDATLGLADLLLSSDLTPRLAEIRVPTLLLAPDGSPFIPSEVMAAMSKQLPNAELKIFSRAKHGLPLSHAVPCAETVKDFLARHFPQ